MVKIFLNYFFSLFVRNCRIYVYIFALMKSDDAIYIKLPKELKLRVNQYVTDKKVKGGLSGMVKRYLEKKIKDVA